MSKVSDLSHMERLGGIAESIVQKLAVKPALRLAFKNFASDSDKESVKILSREIQIDFLESVTCTDEEIRKEHISRLNENMIKRAEIWTKVLATADDAARLDGYLVNVFTQVQRSSRFQDPDYTKTLERMGATTLARASKRADEKRSLSQRKRAIQPKV